MIANQDKNFFQSNYIKKHFYQKELFAQLVPSLIKKIQRVFEEKKRPLAIADFCCGYGTEVFWLLKQLEKVGVQIEKFEGYDVNQDFVNVGKQKVKKEGLDKVNFFVKDLDKEFSLGPFDIVYSSFGIHWLLNIDNFVKCTRTSMKEGGILWALIGLSFRQLDKSRSALLKQVQQNPRSFWTERLQNYILYFFQGSQKDYLVPLGTSFDEDESKVMNHPVKKDMQFMINFFTGFLPQVKYLTAELTNEKEKEEASRQYVQEIMKIAFKNKNNELYEEEDKQIVCIVRLLFYQGTKN